VNDTQIELAVKRAIDGTFLNSWQFYGAMIALVIIGVAFTYVTSYLATRGQRFAKHVDFTNLLAELKTTTETTESIKRTVQHADWRDKEYEKTRREKLEQLFHALLETNDWLSKEAGWLFKDVPYETSRNPAFTVRMLAKLYFPEINTDEFEGAVTEQRKTILAAKPRMLQATAQGIQARQEAIDAILAPYTASTERFTNTLISIEAQAIAIMATLVRRGYGDSESDKARPA
jgi:hypothetical protein